MDGLEYVKRLNYSEAMTILHELCQDVALRGRIVTRAKEMLSDINAVEIEERVFAALNSIMIEEYWNACNDSFYGYREETEVAFELLEDVVSEPEHKMKEYRELGMKEMEKRYCIGIVGGLYRYGAEGSNEFHNAVPDDPYIIADNIFEEWKEYNPPEEWPVIEGKMSQFVKGKFGPRFRIVDDAPEKVVIVLEDFADKLEEAMEGWDQYLNTATGEFVDLPDGSLVEADEELAEFIDESDDYIRLPDQMELNEYRIMEDFAEDCQDTEKRAMLFRALNGKKPFRRFKDTLNQTGIAEDYYAYRFRAFVDIAQEWCEDNEIFYKSR